MKNIEQDRFVIYKENTGKDYDKRTKLQIYHDLKKEDPNVILSINPIHFMNDKNLINSKLANKTFLDKAPHEIIEKFKNEAKEIKYSIEKINQIIDTIRWYDR